MLINFGRAATNLKKIIPLTPERVAWVNDVDGVHHYYEGIDDVYAFYAEMKYRTLCEDFPHLSREDIRTIGLKSYNDTGDGLIGFVDEAIRQNIITSDGIENFREGIFRLFHKEKFEAVSQRQSLLLQPCDRTTLLLSQLHGYLNQAILTQGCFPNWAKPVLEARGTLKYFNRHACLDFHDVGYQTKKLSTRPLEMAIRALGSTPEQVVFIEDSIDNIKTAKSLSPQILTVLISRHPLSPENEAFVDIQMPRLVNFLEYARTVFVPNAPKFTADLK